MFSRRICHHSFLALYSIYRYFNIASLVVGAHLDTRNISKHIGQLPDDMFFGNGKLEIREVSDFS